MQSLARCFLQIPVKNRLPLPSYSKLQISQSAFPITFPCISPSRSITSSSYTSSLSTITTRAKFQSPSSTTSQFTTRLPSNVMYGSTHTHTQILSRRMTLLLPNERPKADPKEVIEEFVAKTGTSPLKRIDYLAKDAAYSRLSDTEKLKTKKSLFSFNRLSKAVLIFETWTLFFFISCLGYIVYHSVKYRRETPKEIAIRIWDQLFNHTFRYRQVLTGEKTFDQLKQEIREKKIQEMVTDEQIEDELQQIINDPSLKTYDGKFR